MPVFCDHSKFAHAISDRLTTDIHSAACSESFIAVGNVLPTWQNVALVKVFVCFEHLNVDVLTEAEVFNRDRVLCNHKQNDVMENCSHLFCALISERHLCTVPFDPASLKAKWWFHQDLSTVTAIGPVSKWFQLLLRATPFSLNMLPCLLLFSLE